VSHQVLLSARALRGKHPDRYRSVLDAWIQCKGGPNPRNICLRSGRSYGHQRHQIRFVTLENLRVILIVIIVWWYACVARVRLLLEFLMHISIVHRLLFLVMIVRPRLVYANIGCLDLEIPLEAASPISDYA